MLPELHSPIPGPRSLAAAEKLRRYESPNVTYLGPDYPIFWERAEGCYVWDVDGNRYVDWTSAFGVCGLGHRNGEVVAALTQQAGTLLHAMGDVHPTPLKADLCEALSRLTFERWGAGEGRTILGNSGFEAVEAALKTALLATGKRGVIAFEAAYHGLGYGALEVVGTPYFKMPFRQQLSDFATFVPFPDASGGASALEATRAAILAALAQPVEGGIGAILVEPIQGRGGERLPVPEFLPMLRALCDEHGLLLIFDEIYTGLNRTGHLFACEASGTIPDLICLGKGLTSGFPLSACVGRAEAMKAWPVSEGEALHTSTFLGHPVGCAMALASLRQHADPVLARRVRERGEALLHALRQLRSPLIRDVRGAGLLVGLELTLDGGATNAIVQRGLKAGLILLQSGPEGNILGFTPPFEVDDEAITHLCGFLQAELVR